MYLKAYLIRFLNMIKCTGIFEMVKILFTFYFSTKVGFL